MTKNQGSLVILGFFQWFFIALGATSFFLGTPGLAQSLAPRVGFGQCDVSTSRVLTLGGYGTYFGLPQSTRKSSGGVHDPLVVSVMALEHDGTKLAFVGIDSVGLSAASVARITSQVQRTPGLEQSTVIVQASHSHHTPDTMGLWGALPFFTGRDKLYMDSMEGLAAQCIAAAFAKRIAAKLSVAHTQMDNSHSAQSAPGRRDDAVITLAAHSEQGHKLLGSLTQWSAHPTLIGAENNALSADYVGAFRLALGQALKEPDAPAVYLNGALGGTYASATGLPEVGDPFVDGAHDPDVGAGYANAAAVGSELAHRVATALQSRALPLEVQPASSGNQPWLQVRLWPITVPLSNTLFKAASAAGIVETRFTGNTLRTKMGWFKLGPLEGVSIPGEIFPSGSQIIRAMLAKRGAEHTMIIGMSHDWIGYLMAADEWNNPTWGYNRNLSPDKAAMAQIINQLEHELSHLPELP